MRKFSIYAMTTAAALTMMGTTPFSAMAAQNTYQPAKCKVVVVGGNTNTGNGSFSGCRFPNLSGSAGSVIPGSGCSTSGSNNSGNNSNGNNSSNSGSVTEDSAVAEIVSLVNSERAKAGLAPLTLNDGASKAAQTRANELRTSFSHTRPNGKNFATALTEAGVTYRSSGENIAYGQTSAAKVMSDWMNSSGHRANILNSGYTEIGVGHVKDASGTDYWVQLFIN